MPLALRLAGPCANKGRNPQIVQAALTAPAETRERPARVAVPLYQMVRARQSGGNACGAMRPYSWNFWDEGVTRCASWVLRLVVAMLRHCRRQPPRRPRKPTGSVSGLPVPRFVSLKSDKVNVRAGPDQRARRRLGLQPRRAAGRGDGRIRELAHASATGKARRAGSITRCCRAGAPRWSRRNRRARTSCSLCGRKPDAASAASSAKLQTRRARHREALPERAGAASSAKASTAGSSSRACGASIRARRWNRPSADAEKEPGAHARDQL